MFTLVLWAALAAERHTPHYNWHPIAEFHTVELCEKGAATLGIKGNNFRCLQTK